jgi:IS5 family transposase
MRPERTVQASIFDLFAKHEIGCELKKASQWLDEHPALAPTCAATGCRDWTSWASGRGGSTLWVSQARTSSAVRSAQGLAAGNGSTEPILHYVAQHPIWAAGDIDRTAGQRLSRPAIQPEEIRNMSPITQTAYVRSVAKFAAHHRTLPDKLTFENVRCYQMHLVSRGLKTASLLQRSGLCPH